MKIYYIETTDSEWSHSVKGFYSSLDKAKENMCHFSDWYRNKGTGKIYELTLDINEHKLVYQN